MHIQEHNIHHCFFRRVENFAVRARREKKNIFQKKMNSDDRSILAQYCRAQAQLNKVARDGDEDKKRLSERIRTYRSLLQDELIASNITCFEMHPEGKDPVYVRLKTPQSQTPLDADVVTNILRNMQRDTLADMAEKNGHDLPKMITAALQHEIRTKFSKKSDKKTLSISNTKERGFNGNQAHMITDTARQIATDLMGAKTELAALQSKQNLAKEPYLADQRTAEPAVKQTLKNVDPKTMTTRVHMVQDGDEWVYYLRCKEKKTTPIIGVRKMVPMVEAALVKTLEMNGMGREYNASFRFATEFWTAFGKILVVAFDKAVSETKTVSHITLDRGAPRAKRKKTE